MPNASAALLRTAPTPQLPPERSIVCVDPLADPDWDRLVGQFPGAAFFHGRAWARTLHESYGYGPAYLVLREHEEVRGVLPLMEVSSWLTGRRGVGLPFTDECGPLAWDVEDFRCLYRAARAMALRRRWKYLEVRGNHSWFGDVPSWDRFLSHKLDLEGGEEALFSRCESSVRRAVRKAGHSDVQIEFSRSPEAVEAFHHLLCITRRRHGVPPQPIDFFRSIQRCILAENQGWVVLARSGGLPVAGAVYFHFGRKVIYKYGASDEKYQHLRANNLVMWEAIRRHAADGFAEFDFGRTAPGNEGLRKFKLSWGAKESEVAYVRDNLRSGRFEAGQSDDSDAGWKARILRALPDPVFRLVGSALYKHVA